METRLTQYSHGAGCGCKIAPAVLNTILQSQLTLNHDPKLLVGHDSRDDAAVYDLGNGHAVISTTDFFMPIVDDAFDFGRIAVNNAISDIYAMGGTPLMAIAILGWPIEQLPPQLAGRVVDGGRQACQEAGIQLAGGHSIDAPEPIFGAAVTGTVQHEHLKRNDTAEPGCQLFLTKPLGIGLLTTAEKKGLLHERHRGLARDLMCRLNDAGRHFAQLPGVRAMTDVTGFGLLGHLLEMCQGSRVRAHLEGASIPRIDGVEHYIQQGCIPGGTQRNFESIRAHIGPLSAHNQALLCDPQTSGGLLVAVTAAGQSAFTECARRLGLDLHAIGHLTEVQGATLIECHG